MDHWVLAAEVVVGPVAVLFFFDEPHAAATMASTAKPATAATHLVFLMVLPFLLDDAARRHGSVPPGDLHALASIAGIAEDRAK